MTAMPQGSPAFDQLYSAAYEELRRLAATLRRDEPGETLSATALVNEAYLKLAGTLDTPPSRLHFKRIAAHAMRQVLVDAARRRHAAKRGGGMHAITLDEGLDASREPAEHVIAIHEALEELAVVRPRQARLIEYRYFGGFSVDEAADMLEIYEAT
ncbi:MAG TPA: ECF-type sigma factor, partial [Gemmatimonadaceae bacterium]|nr:ECF-type sigma factor [Gemmatimonadaceae bacterium]